ncbi:MAG: hypothetical protein IPK60_21100 [Sandaracinaceae bacterium]|nr:hypothetical protein [Sandaracinaceae bacterium]
MTLALEFLCRETGVDSFSFRRTAFGWSVSADAPGLPTCARPSLADAIDGLGASMLGDLRRRTRAERDRAAADELAASEILKAIAELEYGS